MRFFQNDDQQDLIRWVEQARKGDSRAWDRLVDRFQNLVYSIARKMGLDSNDAADVFQATFLALYRNLDRIEHPATLGKWLSLTASREALRTKRQNSRTINQSADGPTLDEILIDEEASAERQSADADEADRLRRLITLLGGRCQGLLVALYFEEKSYEEVRDTFGIPMGAIGPTRARCLEKLRKMYQTDRRETPE